MVASNLIWQKTIMKALASLFGKSPFFPLQEHMKCVSNCVLKLRDAFKALKMQDWNQVELLSIEISKLEHIADLSKNEIRNQLPKNIFLPIERETLLNILTIQDNIADTAEDVAILLSLKKIQVTPELTQDFESFLESNIRCFEKVFQVIAELNELFQSSFGGIEAETVRALAEDVAYQEHQVDLDQRIFLKKLFNLEDAFPYTTFHLLMRIVESIAKISDLSEKLANCIRTTIERR